MKTRQIVLAVLTGVVLGVAWGNAHWSVALILTLGWFRAVVDDYIDVRLYQESRAQKGNLDA